MKPNTYERFDISIHFQTGASLDLFKIGLHWHPKHDPDPCGFRSGVYITLMNINIGIGMFRVIEREKHD